MRDVLVGAGVVVALAAALAAVVAWLARTFVRWWMRDDRETLMCTRRFGNQPIWSNDQAQSGTCKAVCDDMKPGSKFTGAWTTTTPGEMSVCECEWDQPEPCDDSAQPVIAQTSQCNRNITWFADGQSLVIGDDVVVGPDHPDYDTYLRQLVACVVDDDTVGQGSQDSVSALLET